MMDGTKGERGEGPDGEVVFWVERVSFVLDMLNMKCPCALEV